VARLEAETARLQNLNDAGKSAEFQKVLQPKGEGAIDFWTFFDAACARAPKTSRTFGTTK